MPWAVSMWSPGNFTTCDSPLYPISASTLSPFFLSLITPFLQGQGPNIKILRNGLIKERKNGDKVEADMGYRGESHVVKLPCGHNDDARRVRSCQEAVNKRFKNWVA